MSDEGKRAREPITRSSALDELLTHVRLPCALSRREAQILAAALRGLDTKGTAVALDLSPKTVDEYWRRVYRKFRCGSRLEVLARLHPPALDPG